MSQPWENTYRIIRQRCSSDNFYTRRGIKCRITVEELKILWGRDRGAWMKRATIDRIDPLGHYEFENCRYLEGSENSRRANIGKKRTGIISEPRYPDSRWIRPLKAFAKKEGGMGHAAKKVHVCYATFSRWINGRTRPMGLAKQNLRELGVEIK